ncbi:hypothetical protein Acr_08g0011340 [Actinidia rufa]|uniref:Uncharacterized protein n=1 Tax=Actinidia rufa TaxID=165716 RepID=A0A7J0F216_9ERIC|nr:hypothetical protein Acr_08g0011340 [Actinidia rufa]
MEDQNEEWRVPNFAPQNPNGLPNPPMGGLPQNSPPNPAHGLEGGNMEGGRIHGDIRAPQFRTLRDYMNPPRQAPSSCIVFPPHYTTLNIRPGLSRRVSQPSILSSISSTITITDYQPSPVTSFSTPPKPFQQPHQAQPNICQPPHKRTFEDTVQQFMQYQTDKNSKFEKFEKTFDDIKSQLTLLTQALTLTKKSKLLAQPQPNPSRNVHSTETLNQQSSSHEQVQTITILTSGKAIDKTILSSNPKGRRSASKVAEGSIERERKSSEKGNDERKEKSWSVSKGEEVLSEEREVLAHAPFPHRLAKPKNN